MIALVTLLLFKSAFANDIKTCENRIWGFVEYEVKMNGVIVLKKSLSPPMDWSASSEFDGFVVKKEDAAETLTITLKKTPDSHILKSEEKPFDTWSLDNNYKKALLIPKDLLNEHQGTYTLQLKKGSEILCESTFNAFTEE